MQLLSIAVALAALGFTFTLSRSRRGADRYGIVLVVLPLALATPLVSLMASGLQLIYGYREAASGAGLAALTHSVMRALDVQYVGHLTLLALLGVLAVVSIALLASRQPTMNEDTETDDDTSSESKPLSKFAIPLMAAAVFVCIVAVATLSEFEDRFVALPVAFVVAFDADDLSEFSPNQRAVDDQQRRGSNALVVETFRALVVMMLCLVLFDAFLVGSRSTTFTRTTLILSLALIVVASAVSYRAFSRQREFRQTIVKRLRSLAEARAESKKTFQDEEADPDAEENEIPE